jgi:hypothetical protein
MAKKGRPTLLEEREIREELQKYLPNIYAFYKEIFSGSNKVLKEKVASKVLDKLLADVKPDEAELLGRIERIEELVNKLPNNQK